MKFEVDKEACIGCGACTSIAPDVFEIGDDGLAEVVKDNIGEEKEDVIDASESCPTEAIEVEE